MSFFGGGKSGKVKESDLPQSVLDKIEELEQTLATLDPNLGNVDLGSFDDK